MRTAPLLVLLAACDIEAGIGESRDRDNDGFSFNDGDCDDHDDRIGPAPTFVEICDGLDNDCSSEPDDGGVCRRAEFFVQGVVADVLFVVDDSPSMGEEQQRLAASANEFLAELFIDGASVHLGVITTDAEGPQAGILAKHEGARWADDSLGLEEASAWLMAALQVGIDGAQAEKPRAAIRSALDTHGETANAGFLREEAFLVAVVLSDEDDASGEDPSINDFVDWLDLRKGLERVAVHVIVGPEAPDCVADPGHEHMALADRTGGTSLDICDAEYLLGPLAQFVVLQALPRAFPLASIPVLDSLQVTVETAGESLELTPGSQFFWNELQNEVYLPIAPAAGSEITVRYDLDPLP